MPKYNVYYTLQGAMVVEANSEEEARSFVSGDIPIPSDIASDAMLINCVEGYDASAKGENTIDGDAIQILDVEVSEDAKLV